MAHSLLRKKNKSGMTPLTRCARYGKVKIFHRLLDLTTRVAWVYGDVSQVSRSLEQFDSWRQIAPEHDSRTFEGLTIPPDNFLHKDPPTDDKRRLVFEGSGWRSVLEVVVEYKVKESAQDAKYKGGGLVF